MYRQIVESGNEGIWVWDLDGSTVYVNERMASLLGYTVAEMGSITVLDVLDDVGRGQGADFLARQRLAGGTTESAECLLLRRDGGHVWTVISHSPWLGDDGTHLGLIAFVSDITERRLLSDALQSREEQLSEALQTKSDFLATMSHEMRTPMNGVIGLAELLLSTELDEQQLRYVAGVQTAGAGLLTIINDILDFSKIEAGHIRLEVVDFDVNQLLEEVTGLLTRQAMTKRLELNARLCDGLTTSLHGDPARLRQVLLNLVSNAIKFTDDGEVEISAQVVASSAAAADIRFQVRDTSIGIARSDQHRIFEPFSQVDASPTRRFGGTGLGLAISRQLVGAMGGDLTVESEPGTGSVFGFTVRLQRSGPS